MIRTVFCNNDFGVPAAVLMNMVDGGVHVLDDLDAALKSAVLVLHGLGRGRAEREQIAQFGTGVDLDALLLQQVADVGEELALHQVLVDEQRLHGVAGGRVVALRVADYLQRLAQVRFFVDVHVADAFGVAHHRDVLTLRLDAAHQLAGAARDYQVDVLLHREQVSYFFAGRNLSLHI